MFLLLIPFFFTFYIFPISHFLNFPCFQFSRFFPISYFPYFHNPNFPNIFQGSNFLDIFPFSFFKFPYSQFFNFYFPFHSHIRLVFLSSHSILHPTSIYNFPKFSDQVLFHCNFVPSTSPLNSTPFSCCPRSLIFFPLSTCFATSRPWSLTVSPILPVPYSSSYFISPNYSSFRYSFLFENVLFTVPRSWFHHPYHLSKILSSLPESPIRRRAYLPLPLQTCPFFAWVFRRASVIVRMGFEAT